MSKKSKISADDFLRMSEDENEKPYEVGYGKPPKHTQWSKGVSGNPGGGKKLVRTLSDAVDDALNERVVVTQNGERYATTMLVAIVKKAMRTAVGGDYKTTKLMLNLARDSESEKALNAVLQNATTLSSNVQIVQLPNNGR